MTLTRAQRLSAASPLLWLWVCSSVRANVAEPASVSIPSFMCHASLVLRLVCVPAYLCSCLSYNVWHSVTTQSLAGHPLTVVNSPWAHMYHTDARFLFKSQIHPAPCSCACCWDPLSSSFQSTSTSNHSDITKVLWHSQKVTLVLQDRLRMPYIDSLCYIYLLNSYIAYFVFLCHRPSYDGIRLAACLCWPCGLRSTQWTVSQG